MTDAAKPAWTDGGDADLAAPRSTRGLVAAVVIAFHLVAVIALIRAFAPGFAARVTDTVLSSLTVTVVTTPPPPPPPKAPEKAAKAAPVGKKAAPREAAAPKPKIAIARQAAPPVAGHGPDNNAGAADRGAGTGAGGAGNGAGAGGNGQGGGQLARKLELISGNINSIRDYPAAGRDARIGDQVTIQMTVDAEGAPHNCRIVAPSKDPEADVITCRLAIDRFRFRPRLDGSGNPVVAEYRWRQKWWDPRAGN